jgi:hypothetical protein
MRSLVLFQEPNIRLHFVNKVSGIPRITSLTATLLQSQVGVAQKGRRREDAAMQLILLPPAMKTDAI